MATTYADYAPTGLDQCGAFLPDRQDWLVAPISITRDTSEPIALSNWEVMQAEFDREHVEYEIHRFGHWGPGWFEIILLHPDGAAVLDDIERALLDYPILDESHYSDKEHQVQTEDWESYGRDDFRRECLRILECWLTELDESEEGLPYPGLESDYCQNTGMPLMVCPCGNCHITHLDVYEQADEFLCNDLPGLDAMADDCERERCTEDSGTYWRHDYPTAEELIEYAL